MHEIIALLSVIVLFAILFAVGLKTNSNLIVKYAEQIRNVSSPFSNFVGFRRYGRGFQALCLLKEQKIFTRIDTTLSLTWRENPMYYILSPITKDKDSIFIWGTLKKKPEFNLHIYNRKYSKNVKYDKTLKKLDLKNIGTTIVTDSEYKTCSLLDKVSPLLSSLKNCIEFISVNKEEGYVKIRGYIVNEESIRHIFNLLLQFGKIVDEIR